MNNILIFAGTTEGRSFADACVGSFDQVHVCVATEYGSEIIDKRAGIIVHTGRLDVEAMVALMKETGCSCVVDATHPYAVEVTANIKAAAKQVGLRYYRLLRDLKVDTSDCIYVESKEAAIEFLNGTEGNILFTTGSKEIGDYIDGITDRSRIYARFLADAESVDKCKAKGLLTNQILCMQGPFSLDFNVALLQMINGRYMVTKDTGATGGFPEKIEACRRAGAKAVVIARPEEEGYSYDELCAEFGVSQMEAMQDTSANEMLNDACCAGASNDGYESCDCKVVDSKVKAYLVGIGMGDDKSITKGAMEAFKNADVIIGAGRMIESLASYGKKTVDMYKPQEVLEYIKGDTSLKNVAVAFSGDVGFYSGAKKLKDVLEGAGIEVELIPGISSVVYFASKLAIPWESIKLVSLHGRAQNIIYAVKHNRYTFTLAGKAESIRNLAAKLIDYKQGHVIMNVGHMLSYPEEMIVSGRPEELVDFQATGLSVAIIENPAAGDAIITHGLPNSTFARGDAPMTKEEIRAISISKLQLTKDAVVYDVGAGTGSISIECAMQLSDGFVYAIERKEEAACLIEDNSMRLGIENIQVVRGLAPEAMEELPAPTHAFIGGSAGNMKEIIQSLLDKNPKCRIVVNAIAMETIAETTNLIKHFNFDYVDIAQVAVGKSRKLGSYNMIFGQNPVTIFTFANE